MTSSPINFWTKLLTKANNGDVCGQYGNSGSYNQHWTVEQYDGSYYRLRNRATGLLLDGYGRTANGADVSQYGDSGSPNQQWSFSTPSANRTAAALATQAAATAPALTLFPNPVRDVLHLSRPQGSPAATARLLNSVGQQLLTLPLNSPDNELNVGELPPGLYLLELTTPTATTRARFVKQ